VNYLLDTPLISELVRKRPEPRITKWMNDVDEMSCFLSVVTIGEIQKGISRLDESARKTKLTAWLRQDLRGRFEGRILEITEDIAITWGRILGEAERAGEPAPAVDALIAATACAHNLVIVTRNTAHLHRCGAKTVNPWNQANGDQ